MAFAFDTLSYTKRLEAAGVDRAQAEAHAEAARDFIMKEIATNGDLQDATHWLRDAMERLTLQLTVRLGGLIAVGLAALALLIRLH